MGTTADGRVLFVTFFNAGLRALDLRRFVSPRLDLDTEELTRRCEQAIRSYDPCISCATHFLDLQLEDVS